MINIKKFTIYSVIGLFMYIVGTLMIDFGQRAGINLWLLTFINFAGLGFIKYVLTDKSGIFK